MGKPVVISVVILISFLLFNCSEDESAELKSYTIKFGTRCGWCAGQEYITVSPDSVIYERNIPCGDNQGNKLKGKESDPEQWDAITSSFDYEYFKSLGFDECNVCADGCDEIIHITDGISSHQLSYSPSKEIEGLNDLRFLLDELRSEMQEMD